MLALVSNLPITSHLFHHLFQNACGIFSKFDWVSSSPSVNQLNHQQMSKLQSQSFIQMLRAVRRLSLQFINWFSPRNTTALQEESNREDLFLLWTEEKYSNFHFRRLSADKKVFLLSLPASMIYYLMTDTHYQLINCPRMLKQALKCKLCIQFLLKFKHMKIYVMTHLHTALSFIHCGEFRSMSEVGANHFSIPFFLPRLVPCNYCSSLETQYSDEFRSTGMFWIASKLYELNLLFLRWWFAFISWLYIVMGYWHQLGLMFSWFSILLLHISSLTWRGEWTCELLPLRRLVVICS